ncbi:Uncharacterized protein T11_2062 [Trichinella zimbabwensis]|uniref:Amidinotransferase n=1 Tax=Trichinella zimbabwensis TaxID=268475 RepID=A0A0V1I5E2_9BILA|nr:Uncharacterized protein T11_2062 [Trichinella zimbabwensis]
MKRILMCPPTYFEVSYEINPWMNKKNPVDKNKALKQWLTLKETIEQCGAAVETIEPIEGLPDMVFTANAGLIYKESVWLSQFMFPERQKEKQYFEEWFRQAGYQVIVDDLPFEGAGDALFAGNHLIASYGFRTDRQVFDRIQAVLLKDDMKIYASKLTNPRFYHLDTTFCPLNNDMAIWYPNAHTKETGRELNKMLTMIDVAEEEALKFACNAVVINENVILPSGCLDTAGKIQQFGFNVHMVEMSEFMKSGGACKCLTLALN